MIGGLFASVLRANRPDFNQRFAEARRRYPRLDMNVFAAFLENTAAPVVSGVEKFRPEGVARVVNAVYDLGLELAGQNLVGPGAGSCRIEDGWRRVLPGIIPLVSSSPLGILAAVSNALFQLSGAPGARPGTWVEELAALGPSFTDVDTFLKTGQVLAWRAGLAHFRESALKVAASLPDRPALAAVGAGAAADRTEVFRRLDRDPWHDPADKENRPPFRVAARAGAFRGFGGLFVEPPLVACDGARFWVRGGDEYWLLTADCFGRTFHRASPGDFEQAARRKGRPRGLKISGLEASLDGETLDLADLGAISSVASNEVTLALTSPFSHAITLVALGKSP
ncbi:MAG: hypothetical protein V1816_24985 [Pseudomonadota bacterium]